MNQIITKRLFKNQNFPSESSQNQFELTKRKPKRRYKRKSARSKVSQTFDKISSNWSKFWSSDHRFFKSHPPFNEKSVRDVVSVRPVWVPKATLELMAKIVPHLKP